MSGHVSKILNLSGPPYNLDEVAYLAAAMEASAHVRAHMEGKPRFALREGLLTHALDSVRLDGLVLEFGVYSGSTIKLIAEHLPSRQIHGFDSFKGLPEDWTPGALAGHFARDDLPLVHPNVELVVGYFDRVLPDFVQAHPQPVAFMHVDCDLYSSTQTVLTQLRKQIVSGTIIVFDEYFNYPGWKDHEFRAFQEFVQANHVAYEYIGLVPAYEQVAVRIL